MAPAVAPDTHLATARDVAPVTARRPYCRRPLRSQRSRMRLRRRLLARGPAGATADSGNRGGK